MRAPAQFARAAEERPVLPSGDGERVSGYGVMGLTFTSGHVLGLRRWTASSVGDRFTSIWHRDPYGHWTFYESVPCEIACSRYFGASVERFKVVPIALEWETPTRLRVSTADGAVAWTLEMAGTARTQVMSSLAAIVPMPVWRRQPVLRAMGAMAGRFLGVGKIQLTGTTSNQQHFDANPLRIWYVRESDAVVEGVDLGPIGPLTEQARMADFYFPQRGVFAIGRVFITPLEHATK
jgi:hypothetical protein